ncbi:putative cell surface hydrolase (putative) [Lacticaseibacillus pantheris DSM 15945 = JCM 12539 = NBRC 106106]|uniref:Putative cell surface hydrolase (Putative) n=1 Tax=Lacticaseibacillus pantheris DSM 15945 = JCM 12539 = NBRC 106106 TaxID=1423783 RepID=A0A0R1TWW0_9LACO|nr:alpha/beta hydrolase [Lacticaseibacillus pantheris]KRL85785.1 putative cell surface hydrolase (putative) [Lacticaseibacillus pantheris DSM 15945 = JCM 12539 = NBRC 106106]
MKHKKILALFATLIVAVTLSACSAKGTAAPANATTSTTPTFYFHGYSGSANSTNHLIQYAVTNYHAHKVYQAVVDTNGEVTLKGRWPKSTKNPIVQVVFKDNKNANLQTDAKWIKNVLQAVNRKHHFANYNVVAHSMGNLGFMYYVLFQQHTFNAPKLHKQVNIAGHFDGIVGMDDEPNRNTLTKSGRPTILDARYKEMLRNRDNFPKQQVDILNIYGNKDDGTNSDGDVTNVSSRSLRYLLRSRYKNYTEMMFTGAKAQHSQLHENDGVAKAVNDYLY